MRRAYHDDVPDQRRALLRRRLAGVLFALAIEILIVLLLLTLGPKESGTPKGDNIPKTFQLAPPREKKAAAEAPPTKQETRTVTKLAPPPPPLPPPIINPNSPKMIILTKDEFAKADIAKLPSKPAESAAASTDAPDGGGGGDTSGDSVAIGRGPNGEPLFNAEWYREPTRAELTFYLPKGFRVGSAMIACKTAPRFTVEDCVVLGDDPPGTGLARGMREAAWQFRVRAPRKGGQPILGAWVRIRFDFTERAER